MARLYAQFGAVVFLVLGVGGLLTGDAGTLVHHLPQGNLGQVTLHLTYERDILNLVIAGVLGFAGFRAGESIAGEVVLTVGVVLLLLAVIGFANPDTVEKARDVAGLHFTLPINIFDSVAGALGVLCGLGGAVIPEPVTT
ncbi:MAG TPA: hypothetical protein VI434_04430 [Candidatus Dormibacteraeota bacterium]